MSTSPALSPIDDEVEDAARRLEGAPPGEILAYATARWAPRIALATGFGPEGLVLLDLVGRHRLPIEVFTLDTGLLFPETHALWQTLERRYGLRIRGVRPSLGLAEQAAVHGDRLWERDPDGCCALRKVEPLRAALQGLDAWISAIRRGQTPDRAEARVLEPDARFGLVKVNPLATWSHDQVWAYLRENDVPVSPLHARGYPSFGCVPCTSPVRPGEGLRAGRWRAHAKTECGLHARVSRPLEVELRREQDLPAPAAGTNGTAHGARRNGTSVAADESGASSTAPGASPLFPVFLRLAGRRVVLVGGGKVAAGKLGALLGTGASVTVVAPEVDDAIARAPVAVERRPFAPQDLDGAWFVVAAATAEVNREVRRAAEARRVFVNAVDDPESASAYTGGVLRRGDVTVAVSTEGRAPALAGLLREGLDALLPEEIGEWVAEARVLRERQRREGVPMGRRRPLLLEALSRLYRERGADPASPTAAGEPTS